MVGTLAFIVSFFPMLVWHFRRYGTGNPTRLFGAFMAAVYASALVTYTLLPLPPRTSGWCEAHGVSGAQLVPFQFVHDIRRETAGLDLTHAFTSFVVLQVAMNVVLFVPWGVLARRFAGMGAVTATVSGGLVSLLIEATQYTGIWGLYSCGYRTADVDDLMMNTLGALVGTLIAPAVLWWMPSSRALSARRLDPRPVTGGRRLLGIVIDAVLFVMTTVGVQILTNVAGALVDHPIPQDSVLLQISYGVVAWIVVFAVPAATGNGASAGQSAVWLTPVWDENTATSSPRAGFTIGSTTQRLLRVVPLPLLGILTPVGGVFSLMSFLGFVAVLVTAMFSRHHRGLSCMLAGADMVDARTLIDGPASHVQQSR